MEQNTITVKLVYFRDSNCITKTFNEKATLSDIATKFILTLLCVPKDKLFFILNGNTIPMDHKLCDGDVIHCEHYCDSKAHGKV